LTTREEQGERRLSAIMFTDIVGYSALSQNDESSALELLEDHRRILRPIFARHRGREVKTIGDAFLVEFSSALDAVKSAYEAQEALEVENSQRDRENKRIRIRIGIHLGDVVHSLDDVYGDAVNVASRIESLAEAGGICISRQVYESVRGKTKYEFESLGQKELKNIGVPVEVFKVKISRDRSNSPSYEKAIPNSGTKQNRIAVLPFVSISPDSSDEYFADGLTEELISKLSETKALRVIARTSVMNYKKKEKNVLEIGRELGVTTVVEGSVRKAGNRIRVAVQVINAENEEHVWSSTYDKNLDDIFEIQSDIASKVSSAFAANFGSQKVESKRFRGEEMKDTQSMQAYTLYLQGRYLLHLSNENTLRQAEDFLTRAIELDSSFARAYVGRALVYLYFGSIGILPFVDSQTKARSDVEKALKLDGNLAEGYSVLSNVDLGLDEFKKAEEDARRAIQLNPSQADAYSTLAHLAELRGNLRETVRLLEVAYGLDPLSDFVISALGHIYCYAGRSEEALELAKKVENIYPVVSCDILFAYYANRYDYEKMREIAEKSAPLLGRDSIAVVGIQGWVAALLGEKQKALDCIEKIERAESSNETVGVARIAFIYHALGEMDKFFEYYNKAADIHAINFEMLLYSPQFKDVRDDPRLAKLFERMGLEYPKTIVV
jgi:adenylate cyclase